MRNDPRAPKTVRFIYNRSSPNNRLGRFLCGSTLRDTLRIVQQQRVVLASLSSALFPRARIRDPSNRLPASLIVGVPSLRRATTYLHRKNGTWSNSAAEYNKPTSQKRQHSRPYIRSHQHRTEEGVQCAYNSPPGTTYTASLVET